MNSAATPRNPIRLATVFVLALSFGLRAILAYRGGQLFWPDEDRFENARTIARTILSGQLRHAADLLFGYPDHLLFKLAALVPATLETVTGAPDWVSAMFFAGLSTWVLWLTARLARAAGAGELESLTALIIAACCNALFYYSRHFFPYDLALGLLLLALISGLRPGSDDRQSFWTGLWAALGFLVYNGYWTLTVLALAMHVVRGFPDCKSMLRRSLCAGLGLLAPLAAVVAVGGLLGHNLIAQFVQFAGTVNQGDLGDARHFLPAYFWVAEHGLAVLWAAACLACLGLAAWCRDIRLLLWPLLTLGLCALLVVPSDLFHRFAVSARHVRVIAPFCCLATAAALCRIRTLRPRFGLLGAGLGFAVVQAAFNFAPPLMQVFPRGFLAMAEQHLAAARQHDLGPYTIVNAFFLHNPDLVRTTPDPGVVMLRRPHPFAFTPFLYEGYPAATRTRYQQRDLTMRVVRLAVGGTASRGYPAGLIALTLRFPESPFGLLPEPILSTGQYGRGDLLLAEFVDAGHIRFVHDHPGGGGRYSPVLPLDRSRPHRLLVCLGSFFPAGSPLSSRLFVMWDDTVALHTATEFHAVPPDQIDIGHNFIGANTAVTQLSADIIGFERIVLPGPDTLTAGPPGMFRLRLQLAADRPAPYVEPLVSSGVPPQTDLLFLRSEGAGMFRIGHDHAGGSALLSEPFPLDALKPVDLVVGLGSLMLPDSPARHTLFVSCNDEVLFNRRAAFHPSKPADIRLGESPAGLHLAAQILRYEPMPDGAFPAQNADFPGVVRLKFRPLGPPGHLRLEPLLCTGKTGAGDLVYVRYDNSGRARVGFDHWGHAGLLSEPFALTEDGSLNLTIAMGSLFPPADDPLFVRHPEWLRFRNRILVMAGDRILLNEPTPFYPANAASRKIGLNPIGASTAGPEFQADLLAFAQVPPEEILPLLGPP